MGHTKLRLDDLRTFVVYEKLGYTKLTSPKLPQISEALSSYSFTSRARSPGRRSMRRLRFWRPSEATSARGLPSLECPGVSGAVDEGDILEMDLKGGVISNI